ncbi:Ig domain-containing protein [Nitrospira sp. Nam74]
MRSRLIRASSEVLLASIVLASCTVESSKTGDVGTSVSPGNHLPVIRSVRIVPNSAALNHPVDVQVEGFDADGDLITYRQQWKINNSRVTYATLDAKVIKRGDRLFVEVVPYDGTAEGAPVRAEAVIGNTPPEVTEVVFDPAEIRVGDRIQTQVAGSDADDDPIEYRYRWWRNNSEVADGDVSELDTNGFAKGDTIVVQVTPSDPTSTGRSKLSDAITIVNSPPTITTVPPTKLERGRFVYAVSAKDPDDDQLAYALELAPPGMNIDKVTGRIEWPLTGKLVGKYKVRVTATDNEQAKAFQEFDLTFSAPVNSSRMPLPKNFRLTTRLVTPFAALLE